jgi:hypothetical protein
MILEEDRELLEEEDSNNSVTQERPSDVEEVSNWAGTTLMDDGELFGDNDDLGLEIIEQPLPKTLKPAKGRRKGKKVDSVALGRRRLKKRSEWSLDDSEELNSEEDDSLDPATCGTSN